MEADAVQEKEAAERDYQHRLDVAERHRLVQVEKVAKKRQKEEEAIVKFLADEADNLKAVDAALVVSAPSVASPTGVATTKTPAGQPQQDSPSSSCNHRPSMR